MATYDVFLSYSRQQLHFAESLTLQLQTQGLKVWFDLQQLEPGVDWAAEIQKGVDESACLVAVTSRAAIDSPYVRAEWQMALDQGKAIYAALYEGVKLPPELSAAHTIDFRTNFDKQAEKLAGCIRTRQAIHERVPRPFFLNLPTRMPRSVVLIAFNVLLVAVCTFGALIALATLSSGAVLLVGPLLTLIVGGGLWLAISFWRLLQNRADYESVALLPALLSPMILAFAALMFAQTSTRDSSDLPEIAWAVLFLVGLVVMVESAYVAWRFPLDAIRWLPGGSVPQWVRRRVAPVAGTFLTGGKGRQTAYFEMHYDQADEQVAVEIVEVMQRFAHFPASKDRPATVHITVLSDQTPPELAQQWSDAYGDSLISVIAAPIAVPQELAGIAKYQWVDYRTRSRARLETMAQVLSLSDHETLMHSALTVPQNISRLQTPLRVSLFAYILRGSSAALFATAIALLALPVPPAYLFAADRIGFGLRDFVFFGAVAIGLLNLFLAQRVLTRRIRFWSLVALHITAVAVAGYATFIQNDFLIFFAYNPELEATWRQLARNMQIDTDTLLMISVAISSIVQFLLIAALLYPPLRRWLPKTSPRAANALTKDQTPRIWRMNVLQIAIAVPIALFSARGIESVLQVNNVRFILYSLVFDLRYSNLSTVWVASPYVAAYVLILGGILLNWVWRQQQRGWMIRLRVLPNLVRDTGLLLLALILVGDSLLIFRFTVNDQYFPQRRNLILNYGVLAIFLTFIAVDHAKKGNRWLYLLLIAVMAWLFSFLLLPPGVRRLPLQNLMSVHMDMLRNYLILAVIVGLLSYLAEPIRRHVTREKSAIIPATE